jgi:8-oxo-dGTP diphosphatase
MEKNKRQLVVTCSIIQKENTFLITQRPKDKHNGLRWEFPGGKVDFGEDLRDCIEREIKEELDIKIKAKNILEYSSHVYDETKHVLLIALLCTYESGNIKHQEIADHKWVTVEEMSEYDITEADIPFIEKLKELN